jgi:hypothetical protein
MFLGCQGHNGQHAGGSLQHIVPSQVLRSSTYARELPCNKLAQGKEQKGNWAGNTYQWALKNHILQVQSLTICPRDPG